ncbi:hypothetical protein LY474_15960 [Myxococcus stipitatus]|uniref:TPR end-of-group domain-containing protein n=1 Tax=Myxococcus stipitatus TaxID=83455 RepID=UPI001F1DDCCE|nr:hypothetical protein [Myxococcus stipitatus]MCE9669306.1 hypothetical protein [Myxococcus stipitatus]
MRPLVVALAALNLVACAGKTATAGPGREASAPSSPAPTEAAESPSPTDATTAAIDADVAFRRGDMHRALSLYRRAWAQGARQASVAYNAACAASVSMEREEALTWLERAVEAGFGDAKHLQGDPDLANVRMLPGYARLVERVQAREAPREEAPQDESMAPAY